MYYFIRMKEFVRLIITPVMGALIIGYFVYHSLKGEHGLSAYLNLVTEISKAESVLAQRTQERIILEQRTKLLSPNNLDLDILDERVRIVLNLVEANELIIID